MKVTILFSLGLCLCACGSLQEARENAAQNLSESLLEKATGLNIEATNLSNVEDQKTSLNLNWDGKIPEGNYFSSVTLAKDLMAIVIKQDEYAFLINLYDKDGSFNNLPIIAEATNEAGTGVTANVSIQDFSAMNTTGLPGVFMSQSGQIKITEFSKKKLKIVLEQVKLAPAGNTDESSWKTLEGSIEVDHPLYSSVDGSVESLVH